jgi:hypothetical protein
VRDVFPALLGASLLFVTLDQVFNLPRLFSPARQEYLDGMLEILKDLGGILFVEI